MNDEALREHAWAEERLAAYGVGLLPEADTLRLEEHLRACDDCRARLKPLEAAARAEVGHLPASWIATWPRATRLLSGLERQLVESHIESCASCRGALAFAGHEPVLAAPADAPLPGRGSARRAVTPPSGARRFALGFAAAVAAAAVWLLVVRPRLFPGDTHTSATIGAPERRTSERGALELGLPSDTPGAVPLPEPDTGTPALDAPLAGGRLVLRLPPSLRPPTPADGVRPLTIAVLRSGRELVHQETRWGELGDVIRVSSESALPASVYEERITLAAGAGGTPHTWSWTLRVR